MIITPFPFHYQDCSNFCGPACLQLVLQHFGAPIEQLIQSALLLKIQNECRTGCGYFISSPEGLAEASNLTLAEHVAPAGVTYQVFSTGTAQPSDFDACVREIESAIDVTHAPVFALVQSGGHWIVIHGWSPGPPERTFFVRWPAHVRSFCAHGFVHDAACGACGQATDELLTETELRDTLLPILDRGAESWEGEMVLVVPRAEGVPHGAPAAPGGLRVRTDTDGATDGLAPGEEEGDGLEMDAASKLRPEEKAAAVVDRNRGFLADQFPHHRTRLEHAAYSAPLLVERMGKPGGSYWLVPIAEIAGKPPFMMAMVDATAGKLRRAMATVLAGSGTSTPPWVHQVIKAKAIVKMDGDGSKLAATHNLTATGRLVWQHCAESTTPFQPFVLLKTEKGEDRFLDVFGTIHKCLHTRGA